MPANTILDAIKEFIDVHPDCPENYFDVKKTYGFFNKKIYLSRQGDVWKLVELSAFNLMIRKIISLLSWGTITTYGDIEPDSFKHDIYPVSNDESYSVKIKHLYESLIAKLLGEGRAWVKVSPPCEIAPHVSVETPELVSVEVFLPQDLSCTDILNAEPQINNELVRQEMQKRIIAIAKKQYQELFHSINHMTDDQRASLIRLLNADTSLSLGIWDGIMHHGKEFQLSSREKVHSWIPAIIKALSIDQLKAAVVDNKFWAVVDLFFAEIGPALSVAQWTCIIENNTHAELLVKLMLSLPIDDSLYDKLEVACGKVPVDLKNELGMSMLISKLGRFLKDSQDDRTTEILSQRLKQAPKKPTIARPKLISHASWSVPGSNVPKLSITARSVSVSAINVPAVIKTPRPVTADWDHQTFTQTIENLAQHIDSFEKAKTLFWVILERFIAHQEDKALCQKALKYLIRHYPDSVFGQIDLMTEHELQCIIASINTIDPFAIVGLWDTLMADSSKFGFTNETMAINKVKRVLKYITTEQLTASRDDNKLWALLRHHSNSAANSFGAGHLKILASTMKDPSTLAKIVSNLPLDNELGDKLAAILPHVISDSALEMQVTAKILWYRTHVDRSRAEALQNILDERLLSQRSQLCH